MTEYQFCGMILFGLFISTILLYMFYEFICYVIKLIIKDIRAKLIYKDFKEIEKIFQKN